MIELLFSDSAAGALACAKKDGDGTAGGKGVLFTADDDGTMKSEPYEPEPYLGPTVDGSPSDIAAIWLMADIGDISNLPDSRVNLWRRMDETYADEGDWASDGDWPARETRRAHSLIGRLQEAAKMGEPVRIWWSDAPGEACGFYWAADALKDSFGPVTCVKLPPFYPAKYGYVGFNGTGELGPEWFSELLFLERNVEPAERAAVSQEWKKLVAQNAPLRAVINGHLHSVPVDFYDCFLRRVIPDRKCQVAEIIGRALGEGPSGLHDWWYAWRLKEMISSGKLKVINESKTFYSSTVKPAL